MLFAENSADVDADGQKVVDAAVSSLKQAGVKTVEVRGYTDVIAGTPVNVSLSQQRADAVARLLQSALPGVQVTTRALAERDPVADNSTDAGRQQNRRAAIVAVG